MTRSLSNISIQFVKGVGPQRKKIFERLGVYTVEDLFYLFPRRYEDRREITPLNNLKVGQHQIVMGKILQLAARKSWHTNKHVYEMEVGRDQHRLFCVWFNRPYLDRYFKQGQDIVVYGKVDLYKDRLQMVSPEYELISDDEEDQRLSIGRIVPVYPLTRGITQRYLRKAVYRALQNYGHLAQDVLPLESIAAYRLPSLSQSLEQIHFPSEIQRQQEAYRRVSFEEFFLFQVSILLRRMTIVQKEGIAHQIDQEAFDIFSRIFPFTLTASQRQVIQEIAQDLSAQAPMHRLLQGDVGSGKTVVAFFGCLVALLNGHQAAIMAPTEILARQHFEVLKETGFVHGFCCSMFKDGNLSKTDHRKTKTRVSHPKIALLLSHMPKAERDDICQKVRQGKIDLLIGTHALIQEGVAFKNLSFVVIDEQHKFGVRQRALLSAKGKNPDVLVMTATPIPRTLCLTLYGDLDVSTLREMPPGRGKIVTRIFHPEHEQEAYALVRQAVEKGEQAYIVYPVIEESDKLELKSAQQMYRRFQKQEFKDFTLGLIHGQMNKDDAQDVMERFKNKKIDIMVSTTVLEVGVDVPNATVMLIEHAERFGLSQLHQLRGRIGRGTKDAHCLLIADPCTSEGIARIDAIEHTLDGFEIAQKDLDIRGPGEFFGRHQHGLNELKIANPEIQLDVLEQARVEAVKLTQQDPSLQNKQNAVIKEVIVRRYPNYLANVLSG